MHNYWFEGIIGIFLLIGGIFCVAGSIGLMRFPDIYCRMHALTKPVTLGAFNLIVAYILFLSYTQLGFSIKGILAVIFLFLTVPVGSHMIAKAAYRNGVPLWENSVIDQLAEDEKELPKEEELEMKEEKSNLNL